MTVVTVLHPGAMGAEVARLGVQGGATVRWVSSGRSEATRRRAADAGLQECTDLHDALQDCDVVLSICPPAHAEDIARQAAGYRGIYVDANAIAPERVHRIAELLPDATVVDGGIIGPPPKWPATTRLYLSGDTEAVATPV
ncbi:NAD(P)-dependent oxidoreductase [Mycobacterium sp. DSM 3803]|nr:NAD(P)-dependent oxidoreductase [Mycobacterium sp. DSM 3803]